MGKRIPLTAEETAAFSQKARKFHSWQHGQLKKVKRQFNKRVRQYGKKEIEESR